MRERTRERPFIDLIMAAQRAERQRSYTGQVVVRGKEQPFRMGRQGPVRYYLKPSRYSGEPVGTALDHWQVFVMEVRKHSGKHRHQGGLVIYIIEGEGHSIVDGEKLEWEGGDLMLLPMKPGGVEHQHFNKYPDKPVKWIAFIHSAANEWGSSEMVQIEHHPEWRGPAL